MKAVILSAGPGTRLMPLTQDIPKVMTPIAGMPLLGHLIKLCALHGVKDVYLNLWYLPKPVIKYVSVNNFGVKVHCRVYKTLVSATDALINFREDLSDGDFLVLYGDVASKLDLNELVKFHRQKKALMTVVLHESSHPNDSDLIALNAAKLAVKFLAKPHPIIKITHPLANAGTVVCSPDIFKFIKSGNHPADSISHTLIKPLIAQRQPVFGFVTEDYMKDIGTPERLAQVRKEYHP